MGAVPGLGLGTWAQRVPFQRSVRVLLLLPAVRFPTAQASVAERALTASSSAYFWPGTVTGVQRVPFQCSACEVQLQPLSPTAQASVRETALTALSEPGSFVIDSAGRPDTAPARPGTRAAAATTRTPVIRCSVFMAYTFPGHRDGSVICLLSQR